VVLILLSACVRKDDKSTILETTQPDFSESSLIDIQDKSEPESDLEESASEDLFCWEEKFNELDLSEGKFIKNGILLKVKDNQLTQQEIPPILSPAPWNLRNHRNAPNSA